MDKVQEKIQAIKDMVHSYKYDPDFEETKGSLEDLQIDWLIKELQTTIEVKDTLADALKGAFERLPKELKVKSGYVTKIAYKGNEYTIIHPTKRR